MKVYISLIFIDFSLLEDDVKVFESKDEAECYVADVIKHADASGPLHGLSGFVIEREVFTPALGCKN